MNIDRFKKEHAMMLTAVTELRNLVKSGIPDNTDAIAKAIVSISATIKLHLSTEDQYLYPRLAGSADPAVAKVGKKFQDEMNGIAAAYTEFAGKWIIASQVAANPEGFRADANDIFQALVQRIQRENKKLYPLAEDA